MCCDPFSCRFPWGRWIWNMAAGRLCVWTLGSCHWSVLPRGWRQGHRGLVHWRLSAGYHCHLVHGRPELWPRMGEAAKDVLLLISGPALLSPPPIGRAPLPAPPPGTLLSEREMKGCRLPRHLYLLLFCVCHLRFAQSKIHLASVGQVEPRPLSVLIKTLFRWLIFSKDLIFVILWLAITGWWLYS